MKKKFRILYAPLDEPVATLDLVFVEYFNLISYLRTISLILFDWVSLSGFRLD